ncbi:MAG: hypothetical protein ACSLE3_06930 [Microbacteriaceae bacterium]
MGSATDDFAAQGNLLELVRASILSYLGPRGSWSISHERASTDDAFFYSMLADRIAGDVAFRVSMQDSAAEAHRHAQQQLEQPLLARGEQPLLARAEQPLLARAEQPLLARAEQPAEVRAEPPAEVPATVRAELPAALRAELPAALRPAANPAVDWSLVERTVVPADWARDDAPETAPVAAKSWLVA